METSSSGSSTLLPDDTNVPYGPKHPWWKFQGRRENIPIGQDHPEDQQSPQEDPQHSATDSDSSYEDSRAKRNRERERPKSNPSRTNTGSHQKTQYPKVTKESGKRKRHQEEPLSEPSFHQHHRGGRGGGRGGKGGRSHSMQHGNQMHTPRAH